eukprot:CAMPEP_0178443612 /NCGR_PEP_ID=MMETSP0689_2-20121128/39002_1 /TAXON_ID=160604 /ORGANISM="Amphidinium massartii, Strain CS-259" /LENGTH=66 /DNA_ID=CAMNT_0020067659 /DNA_START=59 /DNA_END=255 /DNA_ORIENTATION=+
MPRPDPAQTMRDKLAAKCKGEIISGDAERIGGVAWLRTSVVTEDGEAREGWVLIDGAAKGASATFL